VALKASIFKVNLSVANINDNHYQDYRLTVAKHPSETDTRLVTRLAVYALFSHQDPEFTKGLSVDDEPDLWAVDATGAIQHWIELGQPSDKRIRQACSKAEHVTIVGYNETKFKAWFKALDKRTLGLEKLTILQFNNIGETSAEDLATKNMDLSATLQEEQILLSTAEAQLTFSVVNLRD